MVVRTSDTFAGVTGVRGGDVSAGSMRFHSAGPDVASGTSHRLGSRYQFTAGPAVFGASVWPATGAARSMPYTHPSMWSSSVSRTTGWLLRGTTRSESATSNTAHWRWTASEVTFGLNDATSVSRGSRRAASMACCELAM